MPARYHGQAPIGHLDPHDRFSIRIDMAIDDAGVDAYLEELADPKSPSYKKYLTPEEFRARFYPSPAKVSATRASLIAEGMDVDEVTHGNVLKAQVTAAQAEKVFGSQLDYFREPGYALLRRVSVGATHIDPRLGIRSVHGLSSPPIRHSHAIALSRAVPNALPMFSGPYNAAQIRSAYSIPASATGAGQTVGLIELDGYLLSDINAYAQANGIRRPKMTNIFIGGFDGTIQDVNAQGEVTLDIELVNAMVPQADEIRVYQASQQLDEMAFFDAWSEIANPSIGDQKLVKIISCSWGSPESSMGPAIIGSDGALFKQMAAQGQTIFAAAGDSGAYDDGSTIGVDDPASQPGVVGVGGTSLQTHLGAWKSETTWSGGGGGHSSYWALPSWQKNLSPTNPEVSTTHRNVPDVSMDADPQTGHSILVNNQWTVFGGTSCAAPLWAGFFAHIEQARVAKKLKPLGWLTPALYSLYHTKALTHATHDIADGSSNGYYHAAPLYDNATGVGSIIGTSLLNALSAE